MAIWAPTRRELIKHAPLALGTAIVPRRAWSATGSDTLRFMVLGDWGRKGKHRQTEVADCMQWTWDHRGADFIVTTGDNFYNWGVPDKYSDHWQ